MTGQILRIKQVLELVPVSPATLWRWVTKGAFPQPRKLGANTTVWDRAAVEQWVAEKFACKLSHEWVALHMISDAIEELFGPSASLESEEATLLRGPEPHHRAEGIIEALRRVRDNKCS